MTSPPPIPCLEDGSVRLRALSSSDTDALFALHADERVMRYWSSSPWTQRQQAIDQIARLARERESEEFYPWVATLHDDNGLIGTCSLFGIDHANARANIGYALAPAFWGRGVATRMLRLAIDHAFGALMLNRIEADIDPRNAPSCRLVERARFRREGLLRERWRVGGGVQDTALYGLLRADHRHNLQSARCTSGHSGDAAPTP